MGEMQENFQHKLRSMRNLFCVVCLERWYTTQQCLDPALYVSVDLSFSKTKKKEVGGIDITFRGLENVSTGPLRHGVRTI